MAATVHIHTNDKQYIGALVAQHSMRRNSRHPDQVDFRILHTRDHEFLRRRHGQQYLRRGGPQLWRFDDLQSFTPLRFMPPELMGYAGRAVVVDPDVFAVGDHCCHAIWAPQRSWRGCTGARRTPAGRGRAA